MKNTNLIIGAGVAIVLIVVLCVVLGNKGENYSMFPEFASLAGPEDALAPAATSPPPMAVPPAPPISFAACKTLLKVATDPLLSSPAMANAKTYDKNTKDLAKAFLSAPDLPLIAGATVTVNPRKLKTMMAAAIREAYDAGTATGFAITAKLGALVTKQQMNQLKVKASKTRDLELMSFAGRADKLADVLSDISSKMVSRSKTVCFRNQTGNKYPLYANMIEDFNTLIGPFVNSSTKILSDMNNGGNPYFFSKDMQELSKKLRTAKC